MGKTFRILHDKPNCIGCGACAVIAPKFWEMNDDGKADVIGGKNLPNGQQEGRIEQKDFEINLEAAESCPVEVIHLTDEETGEKLV